MINMKLTEGMPDPAFYDFHCGEFEAVVGGMFTEFLINRLVDNPTSPPSAMRSAIETDPTAISIWLDLGGTDGMCFKFSFGDLVRDELAIEDPLELQRVSDELKKLASEIDSAIGPVG